MELLDKILDDKNLFNAYKQVYKNKGANGIDNISVEELGYYMYNQIKYLGFGFYNKRGIWKPNHI